MKVRQHIRKTKRKYVRVRQHTRKNRGAITFKHIRGEGFPSSRKPVVLETEELNLGDNLPGYEEDTVLSLTPTIPNTKAVKVRKALEDIERQKSKNKISRFFLLKSKDKYLADKQHLDYLTKEIKKGQPEFKVVRARIKQVPVYKSKKSAEFWERNLGALVGRSYKFTPTEDIKDIDQSIVKYLERINKAGYQTVSSCSGRTCDHDYYLSGKQIISVTKGTKPMILTKEPFKKIQRNSPEWRGLKGKGRLLQSVPGVIFKMPTDIAEKRITYKDNKPTPYVHFHKPTTVRKVLDAVKDAGFQPEILSHGSILKHNEVGIDASIPETKLTSRQLKQRFKRLTNILEKRDIE